MSDLLKVNKLKKGIYRVSLCRSHLHNAFNDQLIQDLTDTFVNFESESELRLVILEGEGKSFCAGADLNWMKSMVNYSEQENKTDSEKLFSMFKVINDCKVPVISKITGAALGGGVGLAAVSDYCLASKNAQFGLTEVRLGLVPAVISPFVINKVGESYARAYFLSGERFDSKRAFEIGLIHEICDDSIIEERVLSLAESFLKAAPVATISCKRLIFNVVQGDSRPFEKKEFVCSEIAKLRVSEEGQEGMNALLEKRTPNWIGNENE